LGFAGLVIYGPVQRSRSPRRGVGDRASGAILAGRPGAVMTTRAAGPPRCGATPVTRVARGTGAR